MHRAVIVTLALLSLMGCASSSQSVKKDFAFQQDSNNGLVVVSTRLVDDCAATLAPGERMAAVNLNFVGTGGKGADFFILKNFIISKDFENPDGYFYIRELPAGSYKMIDFDRAGVRYGRNSGGFDKPLAFEVKAGAVRYLGEVTVHIGKCEDKMDIEQKAVFKVSDQRQRDEALFDARMTSLSSKQFEYTILHN